MAFASYFIHVLACFVYWGLVGSGHRYWIGKNILVPGSAQSPMISVTKTSLFVKCLSAFIAACLLTLLEFLWVLITVAQWCLTKHKTILQNQQNDYWHLLWHWIGMVSKQTEKPGSLGGGCSSQGGDGISSMGRRLCKKDLFITACTLAVVWGDRSIALTFLPFLSLSLFFPPWTIVVSMEFKHLGLDVAWETHPCFL